MLQSIFVVVLVIAGVTSVGKTELSLKLASLLNGEVISADSVQVCVCVCVYALCSYVWRRVSQ